MGVLSATHAVKSNNSEPQSHSSSHQPIIAGRTKIVTFSNHDFRSVAVAWYDRMSKLGYESHWIIATDDAMLQFLIARYPHYRFEASFREEIPQQQHSIAEKKKKMNADRIILQLLMAVRWKYLLKQLEMGVHVLLTDADNIFSRFVAMEEFENEVSVDVMHAYATKYPPKLFAKMGFVVCSGMSWWRAGPVSIRFAKLMHDNCGIMCDDQRELNRLLGSDDELGMDWNHSSHSKDAAAVQRVLDASDKRFDGLMTQEMYGVSKITGHRAKIWSRDFAYRGVVNPTICPDGNWVSMPVLESKNRHTAWLTKLNSFEQWDGNCKYF